MLETVAVAPVMALALRAGLLFQVMLPVPTSIQLVFVTPYAEVLTLPDADSAA